METLTIEPTQGEIPPLNHALQRMFYRTDPRPVMPVATALEVVEVLDGLQKAQEKAFATSKKVAGMYQNDITKLKEITDRRVQIVVPKVVMEHVEQWGVVIDPEALVVLRHHGILFKEGKPVPRPTEEAA